ncbi:outer membrane protein transport protein [Acinetobacter sp. A3.8]|uniref:Outer membrane protein transport protein n=1 Tax=Acinetobacter sedimenti TaxID=2919922 RepID=A0A9X1WW22_9GAMM|nr:outer membrane protein transport protein [Acinetobacter sedimenti]MCJ8146239.1 outer membrane protein transport protein [Acinetobacter sedimenti]
MKTLRYAPLVTAILLIGLANTSHARLGQNLSIDIKTLSLGNAVTADPPGVNSIHFNPAGLSRIDGLQTDLQGIIAHFDVGREWSAPEGYGVFGYSDDPLVCNDDPSNPSSLCTDYKGVVEGDVEYPTLYVPVLKKMVDLGKGMPVAAPTFGVAYRPPGSKVTYATAMYAPMIAGFGAEDGNPGNFMGQQVAIERITYLSPSAAYKINDELSVGASIGMSYQAMGLKTDMRAPNDLVGVLRLIDEDVCAPFKENGNIVTDLLLFGMCNAEESLGPFDNLATLEIALEQSLAPSYNLGLLWEPTDDFGFGIVYQSESKMQMKGKYHIANGKGAQELTNALNTSVTGQILAAILGFPSYVPPTESGLVSMDLTYPQHFQTGIKYKVFPDLQVNFDVSWTDFKAWEKFKMEFDRSLAVLKVAKLLSNNITESSVSFPLEFVSSWRWGVGVQYDATDRLQLRLGYEPRSSAIPDNKRNTLVPLNNAQLFGMGLTYKFDPDTEIDLTYAHLRSRDQIPANTSDLANETGVGNIMYNPYAGLNISTNTKVNLAGIVYRTKW